MKKTYQFPHTESVVIMVNTHVLQNVSGGPGVTTGGGSGTGE